MEILNLLKLYICKIMAKAATKLQTKHADGMILPTSSQKYSQIYHGVRGSQETDR